MDVTVAVAVSLLHVHCRHMAEEANPAIFAFDGGHPTKELHSLRLRNG